MEGANERFEISSMSSDSRRRGGLGRLVLAPVEKKEGRRDGFLVACCRDETPVIVGEILGSRLVGIVIGRDYLEGLNVVV